MADYAEKALEHLRKAEECDARATKIRAEWIAYYFKDRERHISIAPWYQRRHMRQWTQSELEALADNACKTDREFKGAIGDRDHHIKMSQLYSTAAGLEVQNGTVRNPIVRQQQRGGGVRSSDRT